MHWPWKRKDRDLDLQRELQAHLELEAEEQEQAGAPEDEARLAARRLLGNLTSVREETREVWGWGWVERFVQDVLYGYRSFRKTPTFTVVVILTLALGIGATSAIFSIVNAVLLQPLPYKDSNKLTVTWVHSERNPDMKSFDTYGDFEAWKHRSHSFDQLAMATWASSGKTLTGAGKAKEVLAMPVSTDFFTLLGVRPVLGRTFQQSDYYDGCSVVLRHSFWEDTFAGNPAIIGKSIRLDEQSCTVLGVMPRGFTFYPDVVPMWRLATADDEIVRNADHSMVGVFGRLKPGVSRQDAQRELRAIYASAHRHDPSNNKLIPDVYPLQEEFTFLSGANLRLSLLVLFAAVLFVLLIACVNVANLLLGRSLGREREFAVRCALGAGRIRLMRQLLTEGLLLSFSGGLLGIGLAVGAVHVFRVLNPIQLPPGITIGVNWRVLLFTVGLAVLTALLFSSVPAWKASQVKLNEALKASGRSASRGSAARFAGKTLEVAEVALSLMLLAEAGLLTRSVVLFADVPLGFSTTNVFCISVGLHLRKYAKPEQREIYYEKVLKSLKHLPGVEDAALTTFYPLGGGGQSTTFEIERRGSASGSNEVQTLHQSITPSYLRVMKTPLLQGRNFDDLDRIDSKPVALINQKFAEECFPHQNPIGEHVKLKDSKDDHPWITIVGVVGDQRNFDFFHEMKWAEAPMVLRPVSQTEPEGGVSVFVRSLGNSERLQVAAQKHISAIDGNVAVGDPATLDQRFAKALAYPRFRALLLGVFAGMALLLASVGLYGVLAQLVSQRTQEIGIRMALGAQKADVLLLIVREGMMLAIVGVMIGLLAAAFLQQFIQTLLYRTETNDIATMAGVSALLLLSLFWPSISRHAGQRG